jgi:plasmid maintenance system killer protein
MSQALLEIEQSKMRGRFPYLSGNARVLQDLAVLYSIRVNQQWRITFHWTENGPAEVAIVDYH